MKYSVIILNYNVKHFVDACLLSVQAAVKDRDIEIMVADNASNDGSRAYLENKYPQVRFLWFAENLGFAKAYNKAVKQAKGKYLMILNPDTLVSDDIFNHWDDFINQHPDFGISGGKMIDGTGRFLPESKRGIPTPVTAFGKLTGLYKIWPKSVFGKYYASHLQPNEPGKVAVLTGALMLIKKDVYQSVGGFDEQYFMYGEDIDLSYTILKQGKQNYYEPAAKIIHFKGESSGKDKAYYHNFIKTTFQFYRKHFRTFPVLEYFLHFFFSIWLRLRKNQASVPLPEPKAFYFMGTTSKMPELQKLYPQIKHVKNTNEIKNTPALLVFDTQKIPLSDIINMMEQTATEKIYFRFYFPQRRMILGSDHRDSIGEVVFV